MAKLFIYLPTYNRPDSLRKQLSVLLPQVANFQQDVRVLICDNDSNKYTEEHILSGHLSLKNVEVRRNGGNIGGNANIALGFVFSRPGEFLWILSDNDIVATHAVSYILSRLDSSFDFYCFVNDITSVKDIQHDWQSGWQLPMEWRMGLISDALYNMATVRDVVEEAFYFHNSSFPHLAVACAAAKKRGQVRFRLLPRLNISADEASSQEQPTDYSLARVCMPLLIPLFPKWEAKSFAKNWLWAHGIQLHVHKHMHPHLYIQGKATLRQYGGWGAAVLLWVTALAAIVATPYLNRRSRIVQKLKTHLSNQNLERVKRVRRLICGK